MSRTVTLVLVDPAGELLGALPPFPVDSPWWQDVTEVVAHAGTDVTVLRLLHADRAAPPGGHVTYLAETRKRPDGLTPLGADLVPHALRAPWAEPGGPGATLAWASGALDRLGFPGVTAHQRRTWNLSAIWRMDGPAGPIAWLKQVPGFFDHEATVLGLVAGVAPDLVPYVMASGRAGRMLLAHVPGDDRYGAGPELCATVAEAFHPVQEHFAGHLDQLAAIPDKRLDVDRFVNVAAPYLGDIPGLADLIDGLPTRLAAVAECGLPDTLIHGDLHPGNVRTHGSGRPVIIDWGDSAIGHPAFDLLRLTEGLDSPEPLITDWARRWRRTVPGSDPERAVDLLRPVASLLSAATYAGFLSRIEQSEWPYHANDVPDCLTAAASTKP
ncbi:phosphotransferase family protein [Actinoplanes sp. HUAS TT8]|uniref:phosphotransferase family protein n=1 Tax=Actinoplanes sp. HUAS TT8 TaxID=3447453 RepID=UPI003F51E1AA